jgi:hypothetical protein
MGTIKNKYVKRETYDKLSLELRQMKAKKEAADRLFWMLNDNRNKDISFWKQGFIATAIGMVVFFINSVLFC